MVLNYDFMSKEDELDRKNPVLSMKDESTGKGFMLALGRKGVGEGKDME